MILSQVVHVIGLEGLLEIREEQPFDTLGLLASRTELSLLSFLDNEKYIDKVTGNIRMIVTSPDIAMHIKERNYGLVLTDNPRLLFFHLHNALFENNSYVRETTGNRISKSAKISPFAYIAESNVIIDDEVVIEPFVHIYENTHIGKGSIIRSGTKIGGIGFEFKRENDGILAVNHYGGVHIGENVEIQNNSCIDRAVYPWDDTVVDDNSKLDNFVHVGHAVKIHKNVLIAAGSIIGGRTEIMSDSWIGVGCVLRNGITVGAHARANMGAVVTKDIQLGESVTGNFAIPHDRFIANLKMLR